MKGGRGDRGDSRGKLLCCSCVSAIASLSASGGIAVAASCVCEQASHACSVPMFPLLCLQVGDSISCAVYDVEAGGVPLLTQRLPEEADDELAELAEEMDQVGSACGAGWRVELLFGGGCTWALQRCWLEGGRGVGRGQGAGADCWGRRV